MKRQRIVAIIFNPHEREKQYCFLSFVLGKRWIDMFVCLNLND